MSSFQQHVHYQEQYRHAVIDHYRRCARDVLRERLVMPSTDPEIEQLCRELAQELHILYSDAMRLLQPVTQGIYDAANSFRLEATNG